MAAIQWNQRAELYRVAGGIALEPDPPIWVDAGKVAEGSLSEMLDIWRSLPLSHQAHHFIKNVMGEVTPEMMRSLLQERND